MSIRTRVAAFAALAALTGTASADIVTRDVALTNDTGVNWGSVTFFLLPPTPLADAVRFSAIRFVEEIAGFSVPQPGATVLFPDSPRNDFVRFNFAENQSFLGNGQTLTFRLTIDDPTNYGFRIGYRKVDAPQPPVPAPGAVMIGGVAALMVGGRRRR